jgi:predicted transcriptional regulator
MWHVGIKRKRALIELLEKHRYLRTSMIAQAIYPSRHQCQVSLKGLHDKKVVKRFRMDSREDFIYHLESRSQKWQHWDLLNRFHFWYAAKVEVVLYEFEVPYGPGQADGFYVVRIRGMENRKFFLEVDTLTSGPFDKVALYNTAIRWLLEGSMVGGPLEAAGLSHSPR